MKDVAIIPLYITHSGCPHVCVYCNQRIASDEETSIEPHQIDGKIRNALDVMHREKYKSVEVAFYGGSFTALSLSTQTDLLSPIRKFLETGEVDSVRISTRPDCIDEEILGTLESHDVKTIELGVQSMDDDILARSKRGHTVRHICDAAGLIKKYNFSLGIHLMIGLPGDTPEHSIESARKVIGLDPDFVRIHPTLVLKGTELEGLFRKGIYTPWDANSILSTLKEMLGIFKKADIKIVRIGLQPSKALLLKENVVAGYNHPAIREVCESMIFLDAMSELVRKANSSEITFSHNPADTSKVLGHKKYNLEKLAEEFPRHRFSFEKTDNVSKGDIQLK